MSPFQCQQGDTVLSERLQPPAPPAAPSPQGPSEDGGAGPQEGLRQGPTTLRSLACVPWLPEPRWGIQAPRRARGWGYGTQEPREGGRKPRVTGTPPKSSTPEPFKICPLRPCGIHRPYRQLSPPAEDKSLLRSKRPPTPSPHLRFRWPGGALNGSSRESRRAEGCDPGPGHRSHPPEPAQHPGPWLLTADEGRRVGREGIEDAV